MIVIIIIDQHILKEAKSRQKSVVLAWIDFKKASDVVPQMWVIMSEKV